MIGMQWKTLWRTGWPSRYDIISNGKVSTRLEELAGLDLGSGHIVETGLDS